MMYNKCLTSIKLDGNTHKELTHFYNLEQDFLNNRNNPVSRFTQKPHYTSGLEVEKIFDKYYENGRFQEMDFNQAF